MRISLIECGGLPLDSLLPVYMSHVPHSCILDMECGSLLWLRNQDLHLLSTCNLRRHILMTFFRFCYYLHNNLRNHVSFQCTHDSRSCFLLFIITSSVSQKQGILPKFLNKSCATIHFILCFVLLCNIQDVSIYTHMHILWIVHSELIQCSTFIISISHEKMTNLVDYLQVNTLLSLLPA